MRVCRDLFFDRNYLQSWGHNLRFHFCGHFNPAALDSITKGPPVARSGKGTPESAILVTSQQSGIRAAKEADRDRCRAAAQFPFARREFGNTRRDPWRVERDCPAYPLAKRSNINAQREYRN